MNERERGIMGVLALEAMSDWQGTYYRKLQYALNLANAFSFCTGEQWSVTNWQSRFGDGGWQVVPPSFGTRQD